MTAADDLGVAGADLGVSDDPLVTMFFDWFGSAPTILVLESGVGSLSLQLAAHQTTERLLGLDRDAANVGRARHASELIGCENAEFTVGDPCRRRSRATGGSTRLLCRRAPRLAEPWPAARPCRADR